eukprot:scaffold36418_cov59-Phaeocystis_antarctica.AAC.1
MAASVAVDTPYVNRSKRRSRSCKRRFKTDLYSATILQQVFVPALFTPPPAPQAWRRRGTLRPHNRERYK